MSEADTAPLLNPTVGEYNVCGCSRTNKLRKSIIALVDWPGFDTAILLVILANSICMMVQSPLDDVTSPKALFIDKLELIFNVIFTIEMVLKVIALGLKPYLSEGWNLLDVVVVTTAWLPYFMEDAGNFSAIRAVRVLRALRTVNRIPSLKQVIGTLLLSLPKLADVAVLFGFFLFLFGIIGVNLFSGKLHYRCAEIGQDTWIDDGLVCQLPEPAVGDPPPAPSQGNCDPGQLCTYYTTEQIFAVNPALGALSYDNCLYAFVTIFQAVSLEGWVDQMYMLGVTTDPTTATIYYIAVVVLGAMFIVNLFLAVMFEAFIDGAEEEDAEDGDKPAPKQDITKWEYLIYFLILGNTISMCITHDGESEETTRLVEKLNYFFTTAFAIEMFVKVTVQGFKSYFESGWNTFDFIVTWASIVDLVLDVLGHNTDILRALRVARVMRLLRLNEDMRRFEATAAKVFLHILNLSGVLVLIIVVAALLGMELFGGKLSEHTRTHFDYFRDAFITVFIVASGENWNDVFAETLVTGSPVTSVCFFVPLFVIGNYVLVNLFIAIICWGWDSSVDPEKLEMETEEEKKQKEVDKAMLSNNRDKLRAGNAELMVQLQELIDERQLGFSASSGSKLMARMGSLMKDFENTADQAPQESIGPIAGVAEGFASLIIGLTALLDDPDTTDAPAEIGLLLEYWDSEHARTSGASISAFPAIAMLHAILKKYITAITANRVFMGRIAALHRKMRTQRDKSPPRVRTVPKADQPPPRTSVEALPGDPPGASFLPLTLDGDYGACLRQLRSIVTHPTFDNMIIFAIVCSSLSLAFDMPDVVPNSPMAHTLELLDYSFTFLFLGEMILKLIVFGIYAAPDAYFRSGWNILDAIIVATSVLSLLLANIEGLSVFRALRALRTLRPLRVIQRFKNLKAVVNSLFRAIPAVVNVTQVVGLVTIVYGLFGMQFLMGRMQSCTDESVMTKEECVGTFTNDDGETAERWWGNDDIGNFDHIGYAVLTLFEMSTLEMWPDVMFRAMDADPNEKGMSILAESAQNPWMAAYIISWIIVSAFFLLNLFVGVVLENFYAIRSAEDGSGLMDDDQKEWSKTLQNLLSVRAERAVKPPGGKSGFAKVRKAIFMLVQGDKDNRAAPIAFEKFIISLVLLNVFSMALTWHNQPLYMFEFADLADVFFTAAFTIEMSLKITGLGLRQYLLSPWNVFDGTLVTGSLIADVLQSLEAVGITIDPATLRMLRIFRIARLLRLIRVGGDINRLITTIVVSIPALANVGFLLCLFLYIYAILGVEMFHNLPLNGDFINDDANFKTLSKAMLTLFRCVTGESYNGIMHDAMITEAGSAPGRCSNEEGNCGNPVGAVIFFLTFVVIEAMVMLNLIVAVVLDTFAEEDKATHMKLPKAQIENFVEAWKEVDPEATHYMATKDLRRLLMLLEPPLGFLGRENLGASEVTDFLKDLEVPDRESGVAFHEVLEAIGKKLLGEIKLPPGSDGAKAITKQYGEVFKSTGLHKTKVSQYSSMYIYAVIRMQNAIRRKLAKKRAMGASGGAAQSKPKPNPFKAQAVAAVASQAGQPATVQVPPPPTTQQRPPSSNTGRKPTTSKKPPKK